MKKKLSFALSFLFFISIIISAQDITGNIEGRVLDAKGTSLSGVNITLQSENLQGVKGTASDSKGYFKILFLPVGNYKVKISSVGSRDVLIENVQVRLGRSSYIGEIKLEQQAIDLPKSPSPVKN
jgi:Carboxypeptidase regulatory-like domain